MDHLLSLSQAARLVGVQRRTLQQHIREGELSVFEGSIRQSELLKIYPQANRDRSGMLERMERFKDGALFKPPADGEVDGAALAKEVHHLKIQLGEAQSELDSYREMIAETQNRLLELQERCDRKQAMMMGTLVGWFMHQCKLRERD